MTQSEAFDAKLLAMAVLKYLLKHGATTLRELRLRLSMREDKALRRALAMAEAMGGVYCLVTKENFESCPDFNVLAVPERIAIAAKIMERRIESQVLVNLGAFR
jgi:hypothetical protein